MEEKTFFSELDGKYEFMSPLTVSIPYSESSVITPPAMSLIRESMTSMPIYTLLYIMYELFNYTYYYYKTIRYYTESYSGKCSN